MPTCPSTYRALMFGFLLAAGCGDEADYAEFAAELDELEDEIRSTCGVVLPDPEEFGYWQNYNWQFSDLDRCDWFHPLRGQRCREATAAARDTVAEDPTACEAWKSYYNPFPECDWSYLTRTRDKHCEDETPSLGRPLRDHGVAIVAPILRDSPSDPCAGVRARAAARWREAAQYEHASVASFVRAARELAALGAPNELVRRCREAALDEDRHARVSLAIAASLSGAGLRFGALAPIDDSLRTLRTVALETLVDGCWGEATAAVLARIGASRAEPRIATALVTIASEETKHAELAWATIRWATDHDPGLMAVLLETVDAHRAMVRVVGTRMTAAADRGLGRWGLLGTHEMESIKRDMLERVVTPVLHEIAARTGAGALAPVRRAAASS